MRAGYDVVGHHYVEINGAASKVVKHWYPDAEQKGDVRPLAEKPEEFVKGV